MSLNISSRTTLNSLPLTVRQATTVLAWVAFPVAVFAGVVVPEADAAGLDDAESVPVGFAVVSGAPAVVLPSREVSTAILVVLAPAALAVVPAAPAPVASVVAPAALEMLDTVLAALEVVTVGPGVILAAADDSLVAVLAASVVVPPALAVVLAGLGVVLLDATPAVCVELLVALTLAVPERLAEDVVVESSTAPGISEFASASSSETLEVIVVSAALDMAPSVVLVVTTELLSLLVIAPAGLVELPSGLVVVVPP